MTATNKKTQNYGRLALFAAALLWGVSFVMMKNVLDNLSPLYILSIRFSGAALILIPACLGKKLDKSYLKYGVMMGAALILAYTAQTYGLRYTTPGKNAFLTSVYCIIVPFLYWMIIRRRPDKYNAIAAFVCFAGIGFISLDDRLHIGLGDALTILGGFLFAVHIIITSKVIKDREPVVLAAVQFATAGCVAVIGAFFIEPFPETVTSADLWSLAFLTVICTACCLLLQVVGQKYTPPSQASVILTFESVFGAMASVILLYEVLTPRLVTGFALTFAAVIISETKLPFLKKKRRT